MCLGAGLDSRESGGAFLGISPLLFSSPAPLCLQPMPSSNPASQRCCTWYRINTSLVVIAQIFAET